MEKRDNLLNDSPEKDTPDCDCIPDCHCGPECMCGEDSAEDCGCGCAF